MAIELSRRGFFAGLAATLGALAIPVGGVKLVAAVDYRLRAIEGITCRICASGKFMIMLEDQIEPFVVLACGQAVSDHPNIRWRTPPGAGVILPPDKIMQMGFAQGYNTAFSTCLTPGEIELIARDRGIDGRERMLVELHKLNP